MVIGYIKGQTSSSRGFNKVVQSLYSVYLVAHTVTKIEMEIGLSSAH